jgi:hypothetical protein
MVVEAEGCIAWGQHIKLKRRYTITFRGVTTFVSTTQADYDSYKLRIKCRNTHAAHVSPQFFSHIRMSPKVDRPEPDIQKMSRLLRSPKVYCHVHKCVPLVPIPSYIRPVHIFTPHLFRIRLNIIIPCKLRSL